MQALPWILALVLVSSCKSVGQEQLFGSQAEVTFEGNASFDTKPLLEAIDLDVGRLGGDEQTDRARVDDAAWAIESFYRRQGYAFTTADYELEWIEESPRIVFRIDEGPRTEIASVELTGATGKPRDELESFFAPPRSFLRRRPHLLVEERLNSAERSARDYLLDSGYLRAQVGPYEVELADDRASARVTVPVDSGPRFMLRSVAFAGELVFEEAKLQRVARDAVDHTYTPFVAYRLRSKLVERYEQSGFPDCTVQLEADLDEESGDVSLLYTIDPGTQVTIRAVRLVGLDEVSPDLVLKRLRIEEGEVYDAEDVREGLRQLYRSGLFATVEIELEGVGESRELVVTVEELPTLEFFVEPGWGSYEKLRVVAGVDQGDFLGTGKRVRLEGNLSGFAQGARIQYFDPWVGRPDLHVVATLSADRRVEPAFTSIDYGLRASLVRMWSDRLQSSFGYDYRFSILEDVDANDPLEPEDERLNIASLQGDVTWDERDLIFMPREGTRSRINLVWASQAVGSTVDFVRTNYDIAAYFPLASETILALGWRTAVAIPTGGDVEVPIQERLFAGGENSVRSFRQDQLGPKDLTGTPRGGQASNVVNIELRQGLVGNVSGAAFVDAGAVSRDFSDWPFNTDPGPGEEPGVGLGVGLRYMLPIGPLRLDLAWNPNPIERSPGELDEEWVLHFSVGMPF